MINHFINLIDDPQAQLPAYHLAKLALNLFFRLSAAGCKQEHMLSQLNLICLQ